jgi:ferredoxin/flavodoxin
MTTTIYCYSATGNSLTIARAIAEGLGDTQILPIPRYRTKAAAPRAERVGIVFPIHAWGAPRTVEEFLQNLDLDGVRYCFAVATCGGTAAGCLLKMRKAIRKRGGELAAGFIVRSPGYMAGNDRNPMIETVRRLSGRPFPTAEERLPEIIRHVKNEKHIRPERNALPGALLGNFFHSKAVPQFARLDSGYEVRASCKSCGTCTKICPRGNVTLQDGKPSWHHDCDFCGACATWCPNEAIGFKGMPPAPRRHNPRVTKEDLLWA